MENIIIDEKISAAIEEHRGHSDAHGGPFALDNHTHKELDDILEEIEKLSAQIEEVSAEFDHVNSEIHKHTEDGKGEANDPHTYYATEAWALANLKLNLRKIHQEGPDNTPGAYLREGRETWTGALYGDELKDRLSALSAEFDDMTSALNELREWYDRLATSADDLRKDAMDLGNEAQQKAQYYAEGVSALNQQADSIRDRISRLSGDFNEPVEYKVKHYKAIGGYEGHSPEYPNDPTETETLSGNIGDQTNAQAKEYEGYYCCGSYPGSAQGPSGSPEQKTITKNGNNDIDIYYSLLFYNVYFETDGGSSVDSITAYYGAPIYGAITTQNPTKQGYEFEGWDCGGITSMPAHDITLSAKWRAGSTTYTVTHLYENLEGDYDQENVETQYGTTGLSTNAQASNKNPAGFDTLPFEQQVISADGSTNVDIKYDRKTFTVTWYPGIEGMDPGEDSYKYEASCSVQPAPSREGYMFDGWWRNGLSVQGPFQVTENTSISAHWKECNGSYQVKHYQETDVCPDDSPEYMLQETETLSGVIGQSSNATAKSYDGFTAKPFNQITVTAEGESSNIVEIYYDRNRVVLSLYDDGSVLSTFNCKYNKPISYQIDIPIKEGYSFKEWNPMIPYSISSDYSCSATWNKNKHTLHLEYDFDDMLPDDVEYEYGATLSVDNPGRGKYEFKGWDPSLPETMPDNDLTATAQWELSAVDYYLHHDREKLDGTYETYGVNRLSGVVGEQANLSTETYEGFTAEPIESHTLTKEDDEQVFTIKYKRNTYTVSFDASEYFNVSQSNTYKYDEDFPAPPTVESTEEREFLGWTENGTDVISSFPMFVTENKSYTAKSKEPDTVTYTIKHLGEDLETEGQYGVELSTETLSGKLGSTVWYSSKNFTGFEPTHNIGSIDLSADGIEVEIDYDRKEYLISFEDEDESIPAYDGGNYKYETPWSEVTVPTPTKEHYNFTEWDAEFPETVTEDKTFHAKWAIEQHTYTEKHYAETLSGDYEEISSETLTADYGTVVGFNGNPPYGFHVKDHSPSTTISADGIELSARYERNNYSLYWDFCLDDGSSPIFKVYKYETPKSEYEDEDPAVPEREGYTFDGWTELPEKLTADTTISAKWTADEDTVKYNISYLGQSWNSSKNNSGSSWDPSNDYEFGILSSVTDKEGKVGDTVEIGPDLPVETDWHLSGFEPNGSVSSITLEKKDYTETFRVYYRRKTFTVTWKFGIDGKEDQVETWPFDTRDDQYQVPTVPTRQGYTFDGWDTIPTYLTMDTTISAKWTEHRFTATFWTQDDNGTMSKYEENDLLSGDTISRPSTNPTRENATFTGWSNSDKIGSKITQNETFVAQWAENTVPYTVKHVKHSSLNESNDSTETLGIDNGDGVLNLDITIYHKDIEGYIADDPDSLKLENENQEFVVDYYPDQYKLTLKRYPQEKTDYTPDSYYVEYGKALSDIYQIANHPTSCTVGDASYSWNSWENCPDTMPANDLTVDSAWDVAYPCTLSSSWTIELLAGGTESGYWEEYSELVKPGETVTVNRPTHNNFTASGPETVSFTMPEEPYSDVPWSFENRYERYTVTYQIKSEDLSGISTEISKDYPKTETYLSGDNLDNGPSITTKDGDKTYWKYPEGYNPGSVIDQDLTATLVCEWPRASYYFSDKVQKYKDDSTYSFRRQKTEPEDDFYKCEEYTRITGRPIDSYQNHSRTESESVTITSLGVEVNTYFYIDVVSANFYVPDGVLTAQTNSSGYVTVGTKDKYKVGDTTTEAYWDENTPASKLKREMNSLITSISESYTSLGHFEVDESQFGEDSSYSGGEYDFEYKFVQDKAPYKYRYFLKKPNGSYEKYGKDSPYQGIGNIGSKTTSDIQDGSRVIVYKDNGYGDYSNLIVDSQNAGTIGKDPENNIHEIYVSWPNCTVTIHFQYFNDKGWGPYAMDGKDFTLTGYPGEKLNYTPEHRISYDGARYTFRNANYDLPGVFPERETVTITLQYEYEEDEF